MLIAGVASFAVAGNLVAAQGAFVSDTLQAQLLSRPPAIGAPGFIQPWNDYIMVSDWMGDPNLHVIDRSTGDLLVSFGRIGGGPGEFANIIAGIQSPSHDTSAVWVFDMRKLMRIEEPGPIPSDVTTVDLTAVPQLLAAAWLDSVTIVGVNLQPAEKRIVFFDDSGRIVSTTPGKLLGHTDIPIQPRVDASMQFSFCVHPDGDGFAIVYMHSTKIEIYGRTGKHLLDASVPYSIDLRFDHRGGEFHFVPEWITYSSCWADKQFLYALYAGGDANADDADAFSSQEIHVFDWNTGRLAHKIYLDTRISDFSISESSGWLYAGSLADAGVYRFRLIGPGSDR